MTDLRDVSTDEDIKSGCRSYEISTSVPDVNEAGEVVGSHTEYRIVKQDLSDKILNVVEDSTWDDRMNGDHTYKITEKIPIVVENGDTTMTTYEEKTFTVHYTKDQWYKNPFE